MADLGLRRRSDSEGGFSLPEVLITIVIVSITFTAILGGMLATITVSSLQRKESTADTVLRDAAEWAKDDAQSPYVNCAGSNAYGLAGLSVPSGYTASVTNVQYWDGAVPAPGSPYSVAFTASCPSSDRGLQRVTITARSSDGQAVETLQVLKRRVGA